MGQNLGVFTDATDKGINSEEKIMEIPKQEYALETELTWMENQSEPISDIAIERNNAQEPIKNGKYETFYDDGKKRSSIEYLKENYMVIKLFGSLWGVIRKAFLRKWRSEWTVLVRNRDGFIQNCQL